ncbi:MAG TPA: hypothetical protein DCY13_05875 [Verrucomicrobiales bacterium]|nr:hypothetical protein [Verrucomicrobiales bacterium]
MKLKQVISLLVVLALGAGAIKYALDNLESAPAKDPHGRQHGDAHGHADDHSEHAAGEPGEWERGPHGGRMLRDGGFAVEITIFERGVPPQFRVYCFRDGQPVDPALVKLEIQLERLGGRTDHIRFRQEGEHLVGDRTVYEPHSFSAHVTAETADRSHSWRYESPEARIELTPGTARSSGVVVESAGPAAIRSVLVANGRIVPNEDRMKHVVPRFAGVLKEVRGKLGEAVREGDVLAVVESNESLQDYEVRSGLAGTIVAKHAVAGEFVKEGDAIFVVADLGTVWVDLNVHRQDAGHVRVGQVVVLEGGEGLPKAEGTISYLSPFGAADTQTLLARVVLPNPEGVWRPGLFVSGKILLEEVSVPVAVRAGAVQTFRDWTVVFVNEGNLYEPLVIGTGRSDGEWVEVTTGMKPGMRYVAENSFIIKADILKSGASHDH